MLPSRRGYYCTPVRICLMILAWCGFVLVIFVGFPAIERKCREKHNVADNGIFAIVYNVTMIGSKYRVGAIFDYKDYCEFETKQNFSVGEKIKVWVTNKHDRCSLTEEHVYINCHSSITLCILYCIFVVFGTCIDYANRDIDITCCNPSMCHGERERLP